MELKLVVFVSSSLDAVTPLSNSKVSGCEVQQFSVIALEIY
jgi:hypothetical protein